MAVDVENKSPAWENPERFVLTPQQLSFFECFGFLRIPALFSEREMEIISAGMDEVFADFDKLPPDQAVHSKSASIHGADNAEVQPERFIIGHILQRTPRLSWLLEDPRIAALPGALIGENHILKANSGSEFYCETTWHPDNPTTDAPFEDFHIKLCLYLEALRHDSGAFRVIPGTHFYRGGFSKMVRKGLWRAHERGETSRDVFGVAATDIPSFVVETDPGDLVLWDYRTMHATFNGFGRRRQISIDYKAVPGE